MLVGLGASEAMPNPFLAPGDLGRARARPAWHHDHQPVGERRVGAPHVVVARAPEGRRVQRVAPRVSGCRCSSSGMSTACPRQANPCPTNERCSGWFWPVATATAARVVWDELAAALGVAGDRACGGRASRAASDSHVARRRRRSDRRDRRDRPRRPRSARHRRARGVGRARSRRAVRAAAPGTSVPAGEPVPVVGHRPGVRGRRRRSSRGRRAHAARRGR